MNESVIKKLKERTVLLKKAIKEAKKDVDTFPKGRLRVVKIKDGCRYYNVSKKGDTIGDYISVKRKEFIRALAQKDYNNHFLKKAKSELSLIERFLSKLASDNADEAYLKLSPERKKLVDPYIMTDDSYAIEWQSKVNKNAPFMPENLKYDTRRGEKVRSKSEAIIADILEELKIPYHYEWPIKLSDGMRCPDFTLLNVKTREVVYLEHFGLLDDEEYLKDCLLKLDEYRRNGIYPGHNLLFTYETEANALDIKGIRNMLKHYFS